MPRIPLYNQGLGPSVRSAVGQLSPRASEGAFTAPGRAVADFASNAQQIAFNFGMVGAWVVMSVYFVLFGMTVTVKFAFGSWKTVKI